MTTYTHHGWRWPGLKPRQQMHDRAAAGANDVLYFWGERVLNAAEVRAMNLRALPRVFPQVAPSLAAQPTPTATAGAAALAPQASWGALRPQIGSTA